MGISIKDLVKAKEISLDSLNGKVVAVDSFNLLYQFLTTIRGPDGSPLTDSNGVITSHLVGLFSRTSKLLQKGIRPVFVFDGKPPALKKKERERRNEIKKEAEVKYKIALEKKDIEEMKKYASRTTRLTPELVEEAKEVMRLLGLPVVEAPSEGEAQASYIVKKGDAFATVSQDFDTLLHGSPKLVRNLSIAGKRKKVNAMAYETVKPELIELQEVLNQLSIDGDQLIVLAMLIGTDYNIGGVKGIGPKTALKLVTKFKKDFAGLFKEVKWDEYCDVQWEGVYDTIKNIEVTDKYKIEWGDVDKDKLIKLLVDKHDFSSERVESTVDKLIKGQDDKKQRSLFDF